MGCEIFDALFGFFVVESTFDELSFDLRRILGLLLKMLEETKDPVFNQNAAELLNLNLLFLLYN